MIGFLARQVSDPAHIDYSCRVLILTRRVGENIVVGDDIVISVMEVRGDAVRIGVQAPRSVTVHREEVYRELQRANRAAAQSGATSDEAMAAVANILRGSTKPPAGQPAPHAQRATSADPNPRPRVTPPKPGSHD